MSCKKRTIYGVYVVRNDYMNDEVNHTESCDILHSSNHSYRQTYMIHESLTHHVRFTRVCISSHYSELRQGRWSPCLAADPIPRPSMGSLQAKVVLVMVLLQHGVRTTESSVVFVSHQSGACAEFTVQTKDREVE